MGSVYVHSSAENAEMLMSEDLINGDFGINSAEQMASFNLTINKLKKIEEQLRTEAANFLGGYSIEKAQEIADKSEDLLIQLVNRVLYGSKANALTASLTRNQTLKNVNSIRNKIETEFGKELAAKIKSDMSTSELASVLAKELSGGATVIEVSTAGTQIKQLSKIFDVQKINTSSWRKSPVVDVVSDQIFRSSKALATSKNRAYRNMIKSVLESSKYFSTQRMSTAVAKFCNELEKAMLKEYPNIIPFLYGGNDLEKQIHNFIAKLQPALTAVFKSGEIQKKMKDRSNVVGAIGEEIRSTVTRVASNATLVSFTIGGDTDAAGVEKVNQILKQRGASLISEMKSFKKSNGQSQTDVVLLNTRTGRTARAQSKNRFAAHFTQNTKNKEIENFRWKVEDSVNLSNFITNLSSSELGINLTNTDLTNINTAIANNLWFSTYDSATAGVGDEVPGIDFTSVNPPDILDSFEGAMEKALAGQITNLLGITIDVNTGDMIGGGSNIFYLLNGRMKESADLVHQAIEQMEKNMLQTLNSNLKRLVIVTVQKGKIPSPTSVGNPSFLPAKLRTKSSSIGEEMGQKIIDDLKITVSLGTSIQSLAKSAIII